MGFGFDAIDKQFKPKKIELECVECGGTRDVKPRPDCNGTPALCATCHHFRLTEAWFGF